jgi:hypothetical protein
MSEHVDTLVSLALTAANTRYGVAVATGADLTHAIERHGLILQPHLVMFEVLSLVVACPGVGLVVSSPVGPVVGVWSGV